MSNPSTETVDQVVPQEVPVAAGPGETAPPDPGAKSVKPMPTYQSHKRVQAFKIKAFGHNGESFVLIPDGVDDAGKPIDGFPVSGAYFDKHKPQVGGYFVAYEDGYESYSPAAAFEGGYTLVDASKPAHDVQITITQTEAGILQFEGTVNPAKRPEEVAGAAVVLAQFLAEQLPMLVQMAEASMRAKQAQAMAQQAQPDPAANEATKLIQSGFQPSEQPVKQPGEIEAARLIHGGFSGAQARDETPQLVNLAGEPLRDADLVDTSPEPASISGLVNAGGGDFAGAGASGDFDPAPAAAVPDAPKVYEPDYSAPQSDVAPDGSSTD